MIGEKLGRYSLLEEIGSGSMGTVYRAEDQSTGQIVAIKLVRAQILYDTARRERFLRGLLIASQIRHPGICPIMEIGDDDDDFFVVMPFLKGETLSQQMKRRQVPWRDALKLGVAIGEALAAVHASGTVHRALKPTNVWIQPEGTVVLTDCCIARFTEIDSAGELPSSQPRQEFADTIIPMSALAYMSPEQIRGELVDHRSDLFALGAILYEMLCDRHPFEARNSLSRISAILDSSPAPLTSKKQNLPKLLDPILRKALDRRPENRYRDLAEFGSEIQEILEGGRDPETGSAVLSPGARKLVKLWKMLGFFALLMVIITFVFYLFLSK